MNDAIDLSMVLDIFITFLLVFLNGFFVAAEFAIVKVRSSQLELKVQAGHRGARLTKHITDHLDDYLAATQLGITLASLGLGWIGEPVVSKIIINFMALIGISIRPELAHEIALPVAFAIITVLHIVFGELAPKSIAIQRSEKTAILTSYPLQFFYFVFKPFIWVLNGIANLLLRLLGIHPVHGSEVHGSDELKYLVKKGIESGAIPESDYDIIKNAFDFSKLTARQVLVPRTQVSAIDLNDFDERTLESIIEEGYSRIPCFEDNLDNVVGVVYLKDILLAMRRREVINLRDILRPILAVPETHRIGHLLRDFQLKHQQIAVVVNEYGGTKGIITMEDILEELVGEIQDEYDSEIPIVEKTADHVFIVRASASIEDINRKLPHPIQRTGQYDTLAGKIIHLFGRLPNTNDKVLSDEYELTILKKSKRAIALVQLKDMAAKPGDLPTGS